MYVMIFCLGFRPHVSVAVNQTPHREPDCRVQLRICRGGTRADRTLVSDRFERTHFHGLDLSPIQPDWVPENVSFVVDDIEHEAGWTYPEDKFDFIHMRHCLHSMKDRPDVWERIYK